MKKVPLSVIKDDSSKYLRLAVAEEIVITRHSEPAAVLVGFETEDDWFDYRLENEPHFCDESSRHGRALATEKACGSRIPKIETAGDEQNLIRALGCTLDPDDLL